MKCRVKECQQEANQHCSDCLLPLCEKHSKRIHLWLVGNNDTVCEDCATLYWWCEPSLSEDASASSQDYYCLDRQ